MRSSRPVISHPTPYRAFLSLNMPSILARVHIANDQHIIPRRVFATNRCAGIAAGAAMPKIRCTPV
ncbi:hypothetical protein TSMEX_009640 [Taenia solium]|eukprot:TsM_001079800 transcript=TsM_001079800 gene=TsM_001079800